MKLVNKPWGYEKWITEGRYVFKEIFIRGGCKSSLQYHDIKEETNYVIRGLGILYKDNSKLDLVPETFFHILPKEVHRVEAVTDLLMVEASTPEVNDIVRLQDDWQRGDGRIESEHSDTGNGNV